MQDENGIEIRGLSYAYGARTALDDVSISIRHGCFTALLGPNGAGKSTLVALLSGLFVPDAGHIEVLGIDLGRRPQPALAEMGIVFQQQTLDFDLTVRQNMTYFAALRGLDAGQARPRIDACLARMGLTARDREKVRSLNSGHRRRLEIARALVHEPRFLLLDEPTVGLDVPTRSELVRHVHALCADQHLTVLWATHLVDEVWPEDDLVVLHQGRVKVAGAVPEVLSGCGAQDVLGAFGHFTDANGEAPALPETGTS
jgi:ABC-2 type transport system ATP-binding protein